MFVISQNVCPCQVFPACLGKARSLLQKGAPERCFTWVGPMFVERQENKAGSKCLKTFYSCHLQMFVISQNVCPCQVFPAWWVRPRAYSRKEHLKGVCFTWVGPMFVERQENKAGAKCLKTFYSCKLQMFVISQNVCPCQVFPAQLGKARGLLQNGAPERCFTWVGPMFAKRQVGCPLSLGQAQCLQRDRKTRPGPTVSKLFTTVNYKCL